MGIPSYFSYIVKNHSSIIKKLTKGAADSLQINNLYMDCNSIIYDAVRNIGINQDNNLQITNSLIIKNVISKIEEYIFLIQPNNSVFIAFDGVAPVAKLEQQRNRRYKTFYQNEINSNLFKTKYKQNEWNTAAITPGTTFMNDLNNYINKYFSEPQLLKKYSLNKILISTSQDSGEGEHKLFEHIRNNAEEHKEQCSIIYGLDADLIMLSINHLPISRNIYLFRETPEFIKTIDSSLEPSETYLLDIPELANIITMNMNNGEFLTTEQQKNRIYDYIFLCFFLGNDFLPHFPAANIRTGGIDKLLNAYKATLGGTQENLTNGKVIYWKNVRKFVEFIATKEEEFIKEELKKRDKAERRYFPTENPEQRYAKFEAIPTYERELEKYVDPSKPGWQRRYYKALLKMDNDEDRLKQISLNYLEGLEWTMKYYTTGCADWRWHYMHNYPPLFQDLYNYIPYFESTEFIKTNDYKPVSPLVQLAYVLPNQSLKMLPLELSNKLVSSYSQWYPTDCEFMWAFCRYFWESHVELPEIDITILEKEVTLYLHKCKNDFEIFKLKKHNNKDEREHEIEYDN
jgi:5'-3' exonuclease